MASNVNSLVARRMFVLFLIASLIPLGVLALLTFYQVRSSLVEEVGSSLRATAKTVAMDFHIRLVMAQEQVDVVSQMARGDGVKSSRFLESASMSRLSSVWLVGGGRQRVLKGDTNVAAPFLMVGQHVTFGISPISRFAADVMIAKSFEVDGEPHQVIAVLDSKLLWESFESFGELICLSTPEGVQLYCNAEPSTIWREELDLRQRSVDSDFYLTKDNYYTAYWSLFETGVEQSPRFVTAVGLPEDEALGSIEQFESIFIRVVGLTLLLIAFVSIRAIRTSLDPLEKLLQATRSLAEGHFAARVDLHTGDEFEELGGSFNRMADELGKQFDLQVTLSFLGQELQRVTGIETTIELVFSAIRKVIASDWLMVTYIMPEGRSSKSFIYTSDASDHDGHREVESVIGLNLPHRVLLANGAQLGGRYDAFRTELRGEKQYCVVPGVKDEEIVAVLVFSADEMHDLPDSLRMFLDQVGVLLASSLSNVFLSNRLYYQAHHDHLTGLPNRLYLKNTIEREMRREDGCSLVVSIFDIDRFKLINDTQGHAAGDELLNQVAARLRQNLHQSATASRFAGDEFIILTRHETPQVDESEVMSKVVLPIKQVFSEPFHIGNAKLHVNASLGLARYPADGSNFVTLLRNADAAMYHAKKVNPGGHCFYSEELQQQLTERIEIEIALASAVADGDLEMYYQPIIELRDRRVSGAEALLRWNRPGHGQVLPGRFIEIAEETGLMIDIGNWVMLESCRAFKEILNSIEGLETLAVNVSGQQLAEADFVESLHRNLRLSGLPAEYLEIEITETCLVENIETTISKLEEVRALGVRVAIDDFGTGYSSLQYLKRLPVDKLKIDQMFIRELPHDKSDIAIVRSLVSLSQQLNLTVLAEGCETEAQAQFLESESVYKVQGWLFGEAMPVPEFLDYVRKQNLIASDLANGSRADTPASEDRRDTDTSVSLPE